MNTVTIRDLSLGVGRPKVCVPIIGKNDDEIMLQVGEAVSKGADMVEWRVDYYDCAFVPECIRNVLEKLRRGLHNTPLIFTFRTAHEGGRPIESAAYNRINEMAAMSGMVDIVDVEINREPVIVESIIANAHEAGIKVIGSYHDFYQTPSKEFLYKQLRKMQSCGADLLKIAVMPQSMDDVLKLIEVTNRAGNHEITNPLITMSMGDMGSISRICGEYFGSCMTFGSAQAASAPGQFDAKKLNTALDILHENAPKRWMLEKLSNRHLFLIGFMGTGKSTVAKRLAELTGMKVIEMDEEIAHNAGRSISQIFDEEGEDYFRGLETSLLEDISMKKNMPYIISCGGGAVLRKENVSLMKACGHTILLTADPQTVYERVGKTTNRPNLKNRKSIEDIESLMEMRREKYEAAADHIVATDDKNVHEICREIVDTLQTSR